MQREIYDFIFSGKLQHPGNSMNPIQTLINLVYFRGKHFFNWVLANLVGWAVGTLLGVLITWVLSFVPGIKAEFILPYVIFLSLGISIGTAEAVMLNNFGVKRSHWVIATSSGFVLYILLAVGIDEAMFLVSSVYKDVLLILFFGLAVGICQWWVLRFHFHRSWIWIFANLVGHLILIWSIFNPDASFSGLLYRGSLLGALIAVVPGIVLMWFTRSPENN